MLIFSLPLVSTLFGTRAAEAVLPVCCRRDGQHHCGMPSGPNQDSGIGVVGEKCPYTPAAPAALSFPFFAPPASAAIFAGITRHPTVSPQTDAQLRISFDRARQKRGPPALLA
jgi:hypothetical protein